MKQAVREIESMTEGLESAGFDRRQSSAMIHAIANAIEKFAVTPEVLRRELEANNEANNKIIFQRMDRLESLVKLGMGWLFALQLALLGLVGTLAV